MFYGGALRGRASEENRYSSGAVAGFALCFFNRARLSLSFSSREPPQICSFSFLKSTRRVAAEAFSIWFRRMLYIGTCRRIYAFSGGIYKRSVCV